MIHRGGFQEPIDSSTDLTASTSRTTLVQNLPQHHHLLLSLTKTTDENDQMRMKDSHRMRCSRPILLNITALLMCLLSVSSVLFDAMNERSSHRQLMFSGFDMDYYSISPLSTTARKNDKRHHNRNDGLFRQPRVLHVDPTQFYTVVQQDLIYNNGHHSEKSSEREIHVPKRGKRARRNLQNSRQYGDRHRRDPLREGDCEPMKPWQETSFPSCNKMHEIHVESQFTVLTDGGYNTVFKMTDNSDGSTHIAKILKYDKDYTDRNLDRVRRDSLIMERATGSDYVMNTYSYCGFSQIIEYGQGGDLFSWIVTAYDRFSQHQKLQIATQIAQALADVHNLEGNGISSMTHGDFASKQYILVDGRFKLSDFNRGRFLRWNSKQLEPCPYTIGYNDGKFRSPEEYNYIPQTSAIDVWALGSIFIELVTGKEPWDGYENEVARKAIANGKLPSLRERIKNLSDPVNQVLVKAIDMCYVYDPKDRPKAGAVADYLKIESKRLGVEWNKQFISK